MFGAFRRPLAGRLRLTAQSRTFVFIAGGVLAAHLAHRQKISNDQKSELVVPNAQSKLRTAASKPAILEPEELIAHGWGSSKILSSNLTDSFKYPVPIDRLSGRAYRDVVLHDTHGAFIDAAGDLYQWGDSIGEMPRCTLKGENLTALTVSPWNVFALSRSGRVFSLPSDVVSPMSPNSSCWVPNWLWKTSSPYQLNADTKLHGGEKFTSISAGNDHLLTVTSAGRAFTHPITLDANSHGQLGKRKIRVESLEGSPLSSEIELIPRTQQDPFSDATPFIRPRTSETSTEPGRLPLKLLYEIPSLRGISVAQAIAGGRSSYVRTKDSRVLSWGANEYGQLGLGAFVTIPCVFIPTEILLSRTYPSGTSVRCTDLAAGGDRAYFTVESSSLQLPVPIVDVFACGMGQWGALGNGTFSHAQGTPTKVKTISGNIMYDESEGRTQAIRPIVMSASPTGGHALAVLSDAHDILAWGANTSYQLGNGKRSNLPQPTYMPDFMTTYSPGSDPSKVAAEYELISERMSLRTCRVKRLLDSNGKSHGKNVKVREWPVAGGRASLIYWRIVDV